MLRQALRLIDYTERGLASDFNSDGKPNLIWRNPATCQTAVWYMDGVTILSGVYMPSVDAAWTLAGK